MTEPIKLIRDILISEMGIDSSRIWIYNADAILPTDDNLFIVLQIKSRQPYSNNIRYEEDGTGLKEIQSMNVAEVIQIDICSKNTEARERAYEVQLALRSTKAIQSQEANSYSISRIAPVQDISFLEATSRLNRYSCEVRVLSVYTKTKNVDFYGTFNSELSLVEE